MMNINVSIIDQFVTGLEDKIRDQAINEIGNGAKDKNYLHSLAFLFLCVQTWFGFESHDEVFDCITDGGEDFGVDAIFISEEKNGEFNITIFQAKYKNNLDGDSVFGSDDINKLINAVRILFDTSKELKGVNDRLKSKVAEARSLISESFIPKIKVIACNNGKKWNEVSEVAINNSNFGDRVDWNHLNHDRLLDLLQSQKPVEATLRLSGKSFSDDVGIFRVIIGRLQVTEIAKLMKQYGEKLLDRNIRRYLGLQGNRVNEGIRDTLRSESPANFYFYNNGVTLVCSKFTRDTVQSENSNVKVSDLQIVNGGQTSMTILKVSEELEKEGKSLPSEATVLVRIYEVDKDNEEIVFNITHATNSQNPVALKELKSNDIVQKNLEISIEKLGYNYLRKTSGSNVRSNDITLGNAAEAILSVWLKMPNKAKFRTSEHFGSLYNQIFNDKLNGAQVIIAVLIYRIAERHRRQAEVSPAFIRYASCYIAMQMGRALLNEMEITLTALDHRFFERAISLIEEKGEMYFKESVLEIEEALKKLHSKNYDQLSLQQLSGSFRRDGLIDILKGKNG